MNLSPTNLGFIAGAVVIVEILCCLAFRDLGWKRGYREGQDDAFKWLLEFETQVDQARQQIWREEEKKGEWL
jgi:hypothetical protein